MKKTKARLVILTVAVLSVVWLGVSQSRILSKFHASPQSGRENSEKFKKRLTAAIARKRETTEQVSVNLKELTDFEWDRVYVFTPYTPLEQVNDTLGYIWPHAKSIRIDARDDINLIVFTADGQVVDYVELKRHLGDFEKREGFTPDEGTFTVEEKGRGSDGRAWLVLRKANQ
jgi:hypothetical protein